MNLRKLVLACGFASFALSNHASALGLGEVKLKSTLNQPLSAEVQLLDTRDLTAEQIIIALASAADFDRNGVERLFFYTELRFDVVLDHPGGPIVRVTTRNPVREPYLNFLIEARWSAGRLLREYTVLMDLPVFSEKSPQPVQAAEVSKPTAAVAPKPVIAPVVVKNVMQNEPAVMAPEEKPDIIAEHEQSGMQEPPAKKSKVGSSTYGPISSNDTLWQIAKSVRPDTSVSVHQTMLALQRLNPDAFIHGNINLLKKGQILRVPDASEASGVSKSDALNQVGAQSSNRSTPTSGTAELGAQLDASRRAPSARQQAGTVSGSVKLEAPTTKVGGGQGSGANKGAGKALESELSSALEELDKTKSEKTDLSSRVQDLESQVKTMQKLVDVSNEKLRALQLNTIKQAEQASAETKAITVKQAASVEASSASDVTPVAQAPAVVASSVAVSSVATPTVAEQKKAVVKPIAPVKLEKSFIDTISDNSLWVLLGLGALGAGVFFIRRRNKEVEATTDFTESDDVFTTEPNFDAFQQVNDDVESFDEPVEEIQADKEESSVVAETGDVVGEADIYIAYGKFEQAEDMLLNGLEKAPDSMEIRLKLLEVYSQIQNITEFDKHYAVVLPVASVSALNRAKELRTNIAGAENFHSESLLPISEMPSSVFVDDNLDGETSIAPKYQTDEMSIIDANASIIEDDDFTLDLDLDDSTEGVSEAEDLSAISLALDGLDDELPEDDIEVAGIDDEFHFDFNELEDDIAVATAQKNSHVTASQSTLATDDFNFELDVNDIDMAALDHEMESLDADFGLLDLDKFDVELADIKSNSDDVSIEAATAELALDSKNFVLADDHQELVLDDGSSELLNIDAYSEESDIALDEALESSISTLNAEPLNFNEAVTNSFEENEQESWLPSIDDESEEPIVSVDEKSENLLKSLDYESEEFLASSDNESENLLEFLDDEQQELLKSLEDEQQKLLTSSDEESENLFESLDFEPEELLTSSDHESENLLEPLDDEQQELLESLDDEPAELLEPLTYDQEEFLTSLDDEPEELEQTLEDEMFEQALSNFSMENLNFDAVSESSDEMDDDLDFIADADEAATKLDLARAYIDMGDSDGARDILAEVAHEGNEQQRLEALDLLSRIDA